MRFFHTLTAATAMLVLPLMAFADEQQQDIVHGTINIALGNRNGIIVLTDSMLTSGDGHQLAQPAQKLFKLDDRTVCAFAGFAWANAVSAPQSHLVAIPDLNTSTDAVIHEYVRQSAARAPQSVLEKLWALSSLMGWHLSLIATVRDAIHNPTPLDRYFFQLIVAGYDLDGTPKIAKIILEMKPFGTGLKAEREAASVKNVGEEVTWQLNGIPDVASQILTHPETGPKDPALDQYRSGVKQDQGRSMSVAQMKELAMRLAYYTAKAHPEVGGPNQIATLKKGQPVVIEQPTFPEPPKPVVNFSLIVDSQFRYSSIGITNGAAVFVRCFWEGMQRDLDGNYFIANDFRNSTLLYDGGNVSLGETNHVVDSVLILGPHANPTDEKVKQLMKSFTWSRVLKAVPKGPERSPAASSQ